MVLSKSIRNLIRVAAVMCALRVALTGVRVVPSEDEKRSTCNEDVSESLSAAITGSVFTLTDWSLSEEGDILESDGVGESLQT